MSKPRMDFRTTRHKGAIYLHADDVIAYIEYLEACVSDGPDGVAMSNVETVRDAARSLKRSVKGRG